MRARECVAGARLRGWSLRSSRSWSRAPPSSGARRARTKRGSVVMDDFESGAIEDWQAIDSGRGGWVVYDAEDAPNPPRAAPAHPPSPSRPGRIRAGDRRKRAGNTNRVPRPQAGRPIHAPSVDVLRGLRSLQRAREPLARGDRAEPAVPDRPHRSRTRRSTPWRRTTCSSTSSARPGKTRPLGRPQP